jgi:hypothetical protein
MTLGVNLRRRDVARFECIYVLVTRAGLSIDQESVGTNRRYAESIDRRMNARISERGAEGYAPLSLTPAELELATKPLTRTPVRKPVRFRVRFGPHAIKVDAEAVARTGRAVAIRWTMASGAEHKAWVWASAVEPR